MANKRLARGDRKARLWEISWMERKRFWFAVAPTTYALRRNCHDQHEVFRRRYAMATWSRTTPRTRYLVKGSGPHSLVTW